MMNLRVSLDGQTALVTGASSGIGRAIAVALAECGARVAVHYNASESQARAVVDQICADGGSAFAVKANVADWADVQSMGRTVLGQFDGKLDILINNAGNLVRRVNVVDCPVELWDEIIDINLRSVFLVSKIFLPGMIERRTGTIVNVTSIAARVGGGGGSAHYGAAKGGVSSLTRGMAKELAPYGIRVNGISPGVILTRFHEQFTPSERMSQMVQSIPLGRAGEAEECAGAILYLVSDAASFLTGEIIEINGGQLMD